MSGCESGSKSTSVPGRCVGNDGEAPERLGDQPVLLAADLLWESVPSHKIAAGVASRSSFLREALNKSVIQHEPGTLRLIDCQALHLEQVLGRPVPLEDGTQAGRLPEQLDAGSRLHRLSEESSRLTLLMAQFGCAVADWSRHRTLAAVRSDRQRRSVSSVDSRAAQLASGKKLASG